MRRAALPLPVAPDLFGGEAAMEPAERRPDLRDMATLADELAAELRRTKQILGDPFAAPMPFRDPYFPGLIRDFRKPPARESLTAACKRLASGGSAAMAWVRERRAQLGLSSLEVIA